MSSSSTSLANSQSSYFQNPSSEDIRKYRRRESQYQKELEQRKIKEEALRQSIREKDKLIQRLQVSEIFQFFPSYAL